MFRTHFPQRLAAIAALAAAPAIATVTERVDRNLVLGDRGRVEIESVDGSIKISASDGGRLILHAVKKAKDADDLKAIEIAIDESPGRVKIKTDFKKSGWFGWVRNASIHYDLKVPRDTDVDAVSVNGPVTVRDVRGDIEVETVNGSLRVEGSAGRVKATTVNGSVRIIADAGPIEAEAVNGSLWLTLPPSASGKVEVDTVNGSIETDFPLEILKSRFGRNRSIDGQLGEGGDPLSLTTVNGSIKILKQDPPGKE